MDYRVLICVLTPTLLGVLAALRWTFPFPPDSRYYIVMTLRDMGVPTSQALVRQHAFTGWSAETWYFSRNDPVWRMVQPRMLYPILSVPFVALFGLGVGMLVVPVLGLLTTVVATARLVQRLYGPLAALIAAGTLAMSNIMSANGFTVALTDPVAVGLVALMLLCLPLGRPSRGTHLVMLGLLTVLLSLTRQLTPMLVAVAFCGWLWAWLFPGSGQRRRVRNAWLAPGVVVAGTSVAMQLLCSHLAPYDVTTQFLYASDEPSLGHAFGDLPDLLWRIVRADLAEMAHGDRVLLILMSAPLVLMLVKFRDQAAGLYLGGLAGVGALTVANGIPSGMRYEAVLFPIAVLGLGAVVHRFTPDSGRPSSGIPAAFQARRSGRDVIGLSAAGTVAVAGIVAWSATHGSASVVRRVPTSPAAAAALADTAAEVVPAGGVPAELTIAAVLRAARGMYQQEQPSDLYSYADWRHPLRYRPARPTDPGWADRLPDGTAVIRFGDFARPQLMAFAGALSLHGTVRPDSVRVLARSADRFGEDLTVRVTDTAGRIHRIRATVLYPPHPPGASLITQFVYES